MRRIALFLLCTALALGTAACGNDSSQTVGEQAARQAGKVYKTIAPEKVLTLENVSGVVSYTPVQETKKTSKGATVLYRSEPVGQGDVVQVDVYQPSTRVTEEEIRKLFDEEKEKRPKAEEVADLGVEAFIAIPSIHMMKGGYYVKITAGSGGGDEQKSLLKTMAQTALGNLDELLK